jgi:chitodextrinase
MRAAPTLSGIAATAITTTSATIGWTSSEPATSRVEWGATTAYGSTNPADPTLLSAHSMTISGLTPGTLYNFRVRSTDAAGNEAVSGNNTFTTLNVPDNEKPTAPTGLTATASSSSRVTLAWVASTDNVAVTGYRVFRDGPQVGTAPGVSYLDTGVAPLMSYTYTVAAFDAAGNVSDLSSPASVTTPAAPPGPAPRLSADGTFIVDRNNGDAPLFLNGEAAWSLIAELSREDAEIYLADRQQRGFNVILTNVIEHEFATRAPANFYANAPFTTPGNLAMPNEAYFAHLDWVSPTPRPRARC